jgi:hypothetical protein
VVVIAPKDAVGDDQKLFFASRRKKRNVFSLTARSRKVNNTVLSKAKLG